MDTKVIPNCCPKCRSPLPPDAPQGLCPKCLFAAVATPTETGQPAGNRPAPPPVETVAAAFPQLEILEFIGQGGMGFVFKARQPKLDRLVALKILPQSLAADPTFAERFNREARLLARLNHPGIVTVHDFGVASVAAGILPAVEPGFQPGGKNAEHLAGSVSSEAAASSSAGPGGKMPPSTSGRMPDATPQTQFYFLLMEFVDGVNLRQAMQAGRFTPEQALAIVPKICEALQFAHNEGVLHRDIKPENILLDAKGRVKLADFGIAKLMERGSATRSTSDASDASQFGVPPLGGPLAANPDRLKPELQTTLTETGKALGTPNYMAPEQLEHPGEVDHRADIYSLGVVFYEMLTGELPLGRFAPPSQKSAADPRVDEVVLRALEKEKARRYASADEVRTQVETIVTGSSRREEAQTESGKGTKQHSKGTIFRRAALVAVVVALIVFGLAAATTSLMPQTYLAVARVKLATEVASNYDPYKIQNEFARIESPDFLKQVGERANLRWRWRGQLFGNEHAQDGVIAGRLRGAMELRPVRNTAFLDVRYYSTSAWEAADIANAIAKLYCQQSGAHLVDEAMEPRTPVRPNSFLNLAVGLLLGAVLGLIAGGMTALLLGKKRHADEVTPGSGATALPRTKRPWAVAGLFIFIGLWSVVSMLFRQDVSNISIFPSAFALPIGIGLLYRREWCRQLASWGLVFSFVFTLVMCGWVVGKAFGLFPHLNLVAMFLGQPVDSHFGAVALFLLLLAQLIINPWLYLTLIRHEVRRQFAAPKPRLPWTEWGLTLAIMLLMLTRVHVPVKHNWQTGIIFANPPAAPRTTAVPFISAETWSPKLAPGEKPDLSRIRDEIGSLMEAGDYEGALQRQLWYFNHALEFGESNPVRLSFGIMRWGELSRRYPKARQALTEIRDKDVRQFAGGGGYFDLFSEVENINRELGDGDATYALFKSIEQRDPKLAQQCYGYAENLLVEKGEYAVCLKYIGDPQTKFDFIRSVRERMNEFLDRTPPPNQSRMRQQANDTFVKDTRTLVEILVGCGRAAEAEKIQAEAVAVFNDPRLQSAVTDAEQKTGGKSSAAAPGLSFGPSTAATSAFQIRAVADDSDNSVATDTVTNFLDANHVEPLRLLPGVLLDGKAVERAGWNATSGRTNFVIGLTEAGSQQLEVLMAANLKRRIAMVFQGRVLAAPRIQASIRSRTLELPANWDMKDLERTMNGLNQMNNPVTDLRFGPELENIMPPLNGNYTFLNLRANRLLNTSISDFKSRAFHDWQRANGADVGAAVEDKFPVLVTHGMATVPAIANGLDNVSPADIWYNWNLMVNEPEANSYLAKPPSNGQDTYYFRTRDDTWGVLQITGFTKNPRGVKIRYKLVENGNSEAATSATSHEPTYGGRKLLAWLTDIDTGWPITEKGEHAREAIRKMGSNTIPFLLADLNTSGPRTIHYDTEDSRSIDERSRQAVWAFDALGEDAKSAIPELVNLLERNPGYVPEALAGIGRDALPELLKALTNDVFWVRDNTAGALANAIYREKFSGHEALAALPVAVSNLSYTNATNGMFETNTRKRAEDLIKAIRTDPLFESLDIKN